jgi:hypothetical protein
VISHLNVNLIDEQQLYQGKQKYFWMHQVQREHWSEGLAGKKYSTGEKTPPVSTRMKFQNGRKKKDLMIEAGRRKTSLRLLLTLRKTYGI